MKCNCGSELIWGGDSSYEDCGMDENGIVTNLSCQNDNCEVDMVVVYKTDNNTKQ